MLRRSPSSHSLPRPFHAEIDDVEDAPDTEEILQSGQETTDERPVMRDRSHSVVSLNGALPNIRAPPTLQDREESIEGLYQPRQRHPADVDGQDEIPEEYLRAPSPQPVEIPVQDLFDTTGLPTFEESQARYGSPSSDPVSRMNAQQGGFSRSTSSQGTFLSVANGPLARLAIDPRYSAPTSTIESPGGNRRSFLANLLSPRSRSNSNPTSPINGHVRNNSSPLPSPHASPASPHLMGATFNLRRAASLQQHEPQSPPIGLGFSSSLSEPSLYDQSHAFQDAPRAQTLQDMGLKVESVSSSLSLSRNSQPLCGTVLDDKYLLLGTTSGLDFLPFAERPDIKRPINLLKRVRFKSISVLKERSNILLAVAGKNDHVRVYALDGIRAIIEKKMKDVNTPSLARAIVNVAYGQSPVSSLNPPILPAVPALPAKLKVDVKGKAKEINRPAPLSLTTVSPNAAAVQPISPPPDYNKPLRTPIRAGPSRQRSRSSIVASVPASPRSPRRIHSRETLKASNSRRSSSATLHGTSKIANRAQRNRRGSNYKHDNDSTDSLTHHLLADEAECCAEDALSLTSSNKDEELSLATQNAKLIARSPKALSDPDAGLPGMTLAQALVAEKEEAARIISKENVANFNMVKSRRSSNLMARSASREHSDLSDLAAFLRDEAPPCDLSPVKRRRIVPASQDDDIEVDSPGKRPELALSDDTKRTNGTLKGMSNSNTMDSIASVASNASVTTTYMADSRDAMTMSRSMSSNMVRLTPRSAAVARMGDDGLRSLADFFQNEAPPRNDASYITPSLARSSSAISDASWQTVRTPLPDQSSPDPDNGSATNSPQIFARQRKRWSLLPIGNQNGNASVPSTSASRLPLPEDDFESALAGRIRPTETASVAILQQRVRSSEESMPSGESMLSCTSVEQEGASSRPFISSEKLRPTDVNLLEPATPPEGSIPGNCSTTSADKHPANANAPLDYVKLARTKGTRMIKAVETKKRTYLAVLCGETGERIELFTGARNVSLSLNRTFVLPESPRAIEFQLQGDDLVDIYRELSLCQVNGARHLMREPVIYDESIFALEASTVRVREVGITRNERRAARRERERERQQTPQAAPEANTQEDSGTVAEEDRRGSSPLQEPTITSSVDTLRNAPVLPVPAAKDLPPFSTFQQLQYIPPVPATVLASAYLIPPLYTSVIGSTPCPNLCTRSPALSSSSEDDLPRPLLSPISLLANHPARNNGPPGLFFVTRGRSTTAIVDGDGRSVIKKPFVWEEDASVRLEATTPDHVKHALSINRIEVILTQSATKTILLGWANTNIQAIDVGSEHESLEVVPQDVAKRRAKTPDLWAPLRDIVFLGTTGSKCFWSERLGNQFQIHNVLAF